MPVGGHQETKRPLKEEDSDITGCEADCLEGESLCEGDIVQPVHSMP